MTLLGSEATDRRASIVDEAAQRGALLVHEAQDRGSATAADAERHQEAARAAIVQDEHQAARAVWTAMAASRHDAAVALLERAACCAVEALSALERGDWADACALMTLLGAEATDRQAIVDEAAQRGAVDKTWRATLFVPKETDTESPSTGIDRHTPICTSRASLQRSFALLELEEASFRNQGEGDAVSVLFAVAFDRLITLECFRRVDVLRTGTSALLQTSSSCLLEELNLFHGQLFGEAIAAAGVILSSLLASATPAMRVLLRRQRDAFERSERLRMEEHHAVAASASYFEEF